MALAMMDGLRIANPRYGRVRLCDTPAGLAATFNRCGAGLVLVFGPGVVLHWVAAQGDSMSPARTAFFRMSEFSHLKCPCQQCGESIEFPAGGLGHLATCPHCGAETMLFVAATSEAPDGSDAAADSSPADDSAASTFQAEESASANDPSSSKQKLLWISVALVVLAGTAALFILKAKPARAPLPVVNESSSATNLEAAKVGAGALTNPPATSKAPKSIDDLKVGPITLEKARGSSLVYAVGVLRNESGHQRFGVNLELEVTDARGNKVGSAKDYRAVLDPRQEWRFRALVLDSKAVSAKVAAIREEE
jgi:hypothetical protein